MNALKQTMIVGGVFGLMVALLPTALQAQRSGVEAWSQTCGNCHEIQPPNRYTADGWQKIVTHMRVAARISDAESEAILQFLKSGARRVAMAAPARDEGVLVASTQIMLPSVDSLGDWNAHCVACHGEEGGGDGPAAVAFTPRPADFTDSEFQESRTDEDLLRGIADGVGAMPAFTGQLTENQIDGLVQYIRTMAQ